MKIDPEEEIKKSADWFNKQLGLGECSNEPPVTNDVYKALFICSFIAMLYMGALSVFLITQLAEIKTGTEVPVQVISNKSTEVHSDEQSKVR